MPEGVVNTAASGTTNKKLFFFSFSCLGRYQRLEHAKKKKVWEDAMSSNVLLTKYAKLDAILYQVCYAPSTQRA